MDSIGASYNAFTGQEYTGYYAKARPENFNVILDVVSDIYLNQVFNRQEIDKERNVIIEEISMYEDLPMRRVQELFTSLLYGDQPAGWDAWQKRSDKKFETGRFFEISRRALFGAVNYRGGCRKIQREKVIDEIEKLFPKLKSEKKLQKLKHLSIRNVRKFY